MSRVDGYAYQVFGAGVVALDGPGCFAVRLLSRRRGELREKWAETPADGKDSLCREWIPGKLLICDGPMDAHHLLPKQWLKREFPSGLRFPVQMEAVRIGPGDLADLPLPGVRQWTLGEMLSDSRNGIIACRRHHDLIERHLIVVRRADLPERVEEFAAELGDRAVARLERDFGPRLSESVA